MLQELGYMIVSVNSTSIMPFSSASPIHFESTIGEQLKVLKPCSSERSDCLDSWQAWRWTPTPYAAGGGSGAWRRRSASCGVSCWEAVRTLLGISALRRAVLMGLRDLLRPKKGDAAKQGKKNCVGGR